MDPNDLSVAPTPSPQLPTEVALTTRVEQAQARPIDAQRVADWTAAVAKAWTTIERGEAPLTEDVVVYDEVVEEPTLGWSYEVQPGDSLWAISEALWGTDDLRPEQIQATWELIYTWNAKNLGDNPDLIVPGAVIEIPADTETSDTQMEA